MMKRRDRKSKDTMEVKNAWESWQKRLRRTLEGMVPALQQGFLESRFPWGFGTQRGGAGNFSIFPVHPLLSMDFSNSSLTISENKVWSNSLIFSGRSQKLQQHNHPRSLLKMQTPASYCKVAESKYLRLELGEVYFNTFTW